MDDWIQIAGDIRENYSKYDGFVILHGTDTLAYTSSALSFMLENLGKPVIVTGSQIPGEHLGRGQNIYEYFQRLRPGATGATTWWGRSSSPGTTTYRKSPSTSTTSCSGATGLLR